MIVFLKKLAKRISFVREQRGVGLIEVVVSMSILGVAGGLMMTGVFQTTSYQRSWQYKVAAQQELRRGGSWLSVDAVNAETTSLVDGAAATSTLTMTWVDGSGGPHSVGYALDGSSLIRNIDGTEFTIARRVDSVAFSQVGSLLTFDLEIQTYEAASVSRSLLSYLRALQ
jgi:prepilin-type N-terminal cleavage/methylation domain-containing protein